MRTIFKDAVILGAKNLDLTTTKTPTCMIIKDDLIEYVGGSGDTDVQGAEQAGALVRSIAGRTISPGFIDGHMHLLLFGASLKKTNIEDCKNLEEIRNSIKAVALSQPDAQRIFCQGWTNEQTDGKAFAYMLDGIDDQDRPIFVDAKDLHSAWCNTAGLQDLGVQDTPNPAGGTIHRDEDGRPSGLLSETACFNIVWPHVAKVASESQKASYILDAIRHYNAAGYTGMVEMAMDDNAWSALLKEKEKQNLPMRVSAYWIVVPSRTREENLAQVDRAIELHKQYHRQVSPDCCIVGIKLICDGVVDSCTAALLEPYSSNRSNCEPLWPADELLEVVKKADKAGLQCALHAIGDAAVKLAVDTLEAVGTAGRRHRIEHLEMTSPNDARRLGRLGITASVQPVHADPTGLTAWPTLIGDRVGRAFAYKEFHTHGATLAIGTDAPTAPHLPFPNLYIATTRRSAKDPASSETCNVHFALPLLDALTAATAGAAYSCHADDRVGSIAPGMKADFVITSLDLDQNNLLRAVVHETWFDGQKVFAAPS